MATPHAIDYAPSGQKYLYQETDKYLYFNSLRSLRKKLCAFAFKNINLSNTQLLSYSQFIMNILQKQQQSS